MASSISIKHFAWEIIISLFTTTMEFETVYLIQEKLYRSDPHSQTEVTVIYSFQIEIRKGLSYTEQVPLH